MLVRAVGFVCALAGRQLVTEMMCVSGKSAAPFCACEVGNPSLLNGTGLFGSGAGSGEGSRLEVRF